MGLTAGPPAPSAALGSQLLLRTHRSAGLMAACVSGAQQGQDPLPSASRGFLAPGVLAPGGWMTARLPRPPSSQGDWQESGSLQGLLTPPPEAARSIPSLHPSAQACPAYPVPGGPGQPCGRQPS